MYFKVFEKVFEISNTFAMYLNTNTITNTFFANVFEILSNTLKKVFKYFKYKYFLYLTPSLVNAHKIFTSQLNFYNINLLQILILHHLRYMGKT